MFEDMSLSTTVKNRLNPLETVFAGWLRFPFKNIYILNWNSDDTKELHAYVNSYNDPRVIIEDVIGKRTAYFMGAISRNMAAERCLELTQPKWLFQIDCDIFLEPSFQGLKLYEDICYFAECAKEVVQPGWADREWDKKKYSVIAGVSEKNRPMYGTFGSCIIPAHKVWKYGYYNENFIENCLFDCYYIANYLEKEPENAWFFKNEIRHIHHDNESRVKNTPERDLLRGTMINKALASLPPYRYGYTAHRLGLIEIN